MAFAFRLYIKYISLTITIRKRYKEHYKLDKELPVTKLRSRGLACQKEKIGVGEAQAIIMSWDAFCLKRTTQKEKELQEKKGPWEAFSGRDRNGCHESTMKLLFRFVSKESLIYGKFGTSLSHNN